MYQSSKFPYIWLLGILSLNNSILYSAPCLSRYSLFSISINICPLCSKCQVLWGCSQLVIYLSKERTTTCLSQEINPNQWVRATVSSVATFFTKSLQQWLRKRENVPSIKSQKFWILLPGWSTWLMLLQPEVVKRSTGNFGYSLLSF